MAKVSRKENHKRKLASQVATRAKNSPRKLKERARKVAQREAQTSRLAAKGVSRSYN